MKSLDAMPGGWLTLLAEGAAVLRAQAGGVLLVADVHLGYAEAQQRRGRLLVREDADAGLAERLLRLCGAHGCGEVVVVGDLQHEFGRPRGAERRAVVGLVEGLRAGGVGLKVALGNHDRGLAQFLQVLGVETACWFGWSCRRVRVLHGDAQGLEQAGGTGGTCVGEGWRTVCGHVHPAVTLVDGRGARLKMRCFLVSDGWVVLPAFSPYAAGVNLLKPLSRGPAGDAGGEADSAADVLGMADYQVVGIDELSSGPVLRPLRRLSELRSWMGGRAGA